MQKESVYCTLLVKTPFDACVFVDSVDVCCHCVNKIGYVDSHACVFTTVAVIVLFLTPLAVIILMRVVLLLMHVCWDHSCDCVVFDPCSCVVYLNEGPLCFI